MIYGTRRGNRNAAGKESRASEVESGLGPTADGSDGCFLPTRAREEWSITWRGVADKRPQRPRTGELVLASLFEQQPKESNKAFAAFSVYLRPGPERSLAKTAVKLGRSKVLIADWQAAQRDPVRT